VHKQNRVFVSFIRKNLFKTPEELLNCDSMVEAAVLVNTEIESPQEQALQNLKRIKSVNKAYTTAYCVYDFVAKVHTKIFAELKNNVLEHIRKINSVMFITTFVIAENRFRSEKNEC
jgi:DNA-binding Lrp family transcriptional regulator